MHASQSLSRLDDVFRRFFGEWFNKCVTGQPCQSLLDVCLKLGHGYVFLRGHAQRSRLIRCMSQLQPTQVTHTGTSVTGTPRGGDSQRQSKRETDRDRELELKSCILRGLYFRFYQNRSNN